MTPKHPNTHTHSHRLTSIAHCKSYHHRVRSHQIQRSRTAILCISSLLYFYLCFSNFDSHLVAKDAVIVNLTLTIFI